RLCAKFGYAFSSVYEQLLTSIFQNINFQHLSPSKEQSGITFRCLWLLWKFVTRVFSALQKRDCETVIPLNATIATDSCYHTFFLFG
ncbi:hypothetical protein AAEO57_09355, partial [Flavobacterium sp. DGU38]